MREKLSQVSRKQVFVGIASLFLIASGTATVLNYFAQTTGSGTVDNQAVSMPNDADNSATFDYSATATPETYANSVALTNNNPDAVEEVKVEWETDTSNSVSPSATTVNLFDVTSSTTQTVGEEEVTQSYDTANNEVEITISDSDTAVVAFDTNNDGTYDFQIDSASENKDYWEWDSGWTHLDEYRYTDSTPAWKNNGGQEFRGVSFQRDTSADTLTVEVNAERLGSDFSYYVEETDGSADGDTTFPGKSSGDASGLSDYKPGTQVTSTTEVLDGSETRDYAVITEVASNGQSGDYEVTADAVPVTN